MEAATQTRRALKHRTLAKSVNAKHILRSKAILGLSQSGLAELVGVRQPSLAAWLTYGVPINRVASVERVYDLALVLHRELIPERIPQIIRTPDEWLGGRTILDVMKRDGTAPIYGYLVRLFAYQG